MDEVYTMTYGEWRKKQEAAKAMTEEKKTEPKKDVANGEHEHTYIAMKDPPVQAFPPAAPVIQLFTYTYPPQYAYAYAQYPSNYAYAYATPTAPPAAPAPVAYQYPAYGYSYSAPSPIPVQSDDSKKNVWIGRTKAQVREDNEKMALREGVWKPNEMKPRDAKDDQLFWVVELDGSHTLRQFKTIEEDLGTGKWSVDPRYGNAYFVREKKDEKK